MKSSFWNEYKLHIDLYKFYFSLALKANVFFYAVAGAIIFAYYSSKADTHLPKKLLLIPVILSLTLAFIFFLGARLWKKMCERIRAKRKELALIEEGVVQIPPKIEFLWWLVLAFAFIFLLSAFLLIYLMVM